MESKVQTGYLVLADISGYTSYLADTELEHAHEILSDLLNTVITGFSVKLTVAEVEGDAVFAYVPAEKVPRGETLVEVIERAYVAFRDRRDNMRRLTTCICRACSQIGSLDLKFVTHFGSYVLQTFGGKSKPLGSDVNLVHRLLKNRVTDETGWKGYTLFSEETVRQLGLSDDGMHVQPEEYEHLGVISTHSLNLHERYDQIKEQRRVAIAPEEAFAHLTHDFPYDLETVWDWIATPEKKGQWISGTRWAPGSRPSGRTGPGAVNHCNHGKNLKGQMAEEILDWRPLEYYTSRSPIGPMGLLMTTRLIPNETGTRLEATFSADGKLPGWLLGPGCRYIVKSGKFAESWKRLDTLIGEERARTVDSDAVATASA
jgi:hypothetical protein